MTTTADQVIQSIIRANNPTATPAIKAVATRRLNTYVNEQSKLGKKPSHVRAAIKAHVTRQTQ